MEILQHRAAPVEPPPTYDITGLTVEDLRFLRDLFGAFHSGCLENPCLHRALYTRMNSLLGDVDERTHVFTLNNYGAIVHAKKP
jgi:hypothetical protein